jgi:hypothetical protein
MTSTGTISDLSPAERRVVVEIRRMTVNGKPDQLIIRYPGGKAPIQVFSVAPTVDKERG